MSNATGPADGGGPAEGGRPDTTGWYPPGGYPPHQPHPPYRPPFPAGGQGPLPPPPVAHPAYPVTAVPGVYEYHRLQLTRPGARWWRPLLVGLVAGATYVALLVVGTVLVGVAALVGALGDAGAVPVDAALDLRDPFHLTLAMLTIVAMLPAVLLATRLLGARPVGLLASVAGRVRWSWALRCLALSAALVLLVDGVSVALDTAQGVAWQPRVDSATVPLLVVVALLVPAQCVAEEVVFRGYLAQTVGSWLRHPAFAVVLPVPLFVVGHAYVGLAMIDTAVWALAMGWLVWRTGGLEAAAAAHVVNNVVVFSLGSVQLADLDAVDIGPGVLVLSTLSTLAYVGLVEVLARRSGLVRVRVVPGPAVPAAGPGLPPAEPRADPDGPGRMRSARS